MSQGKARKTRKFGEMKRMISLSDTRIKGKNRKKGKKARIKNVKQRKETSDNVIVRHKEMTSAALFLSHNTALGPPYHILLDTNFFNFIIKRRLDIHEAVMNCLSAKSNLYVTDCVMGELEKMGEKYRLALKLARDARIKRLSCLHTGIYADPCLLNRAKEHRCYIVATCDKDLRRQLRRVPGVPIMYVRGHCLSVEKMPDAVGAPKT